MRCPYCQKENPDQAKFCTGCGRKLELVHQPEANAKDQQIPGMRNPQVTEKKPSVGGTKPSNQKPKKKKKKAVVILALLLIVVLVVSLFSCGGGNEVEVYEEDEEESSEEIIEETEEVSYERDESLITADAGNMQLLDLTSYDLTAMDSEEALAVIDKLTGALNIDSSDELTLMTERSFNGTSYYRFQQVYNDLTVVGRSIVLSVDEDGSAQLLTENLTDMSEAETEAQISADDAIEAALAYLEAQAAEDGDEDYETPDETTYELCYYVSDTDGAVLAYAVTVADSIVYVSAETGDVLDEDDTTSSLTGYNSDGTIEIPVIQDDEGYYLYDEERDLNVWTWDGTKSKSGGSASKLYSDNLYFGDTEEEEEREYEAGIGWYQLICEVYDFYLDNFGDGGFGGTILCYNDGSDFGGNAYGGYRTADGVLYNYISIGSGWNDVIESCTDVMAHEFTHAMSKAIIGTDFPDGDEAGALNEGLSDIMGVLIEASVAGSDPDWTIEFDYDSLGLDLLTAFDDRYAYNPKISNYDDYEDSLDSHEAGTLIFYCAYLMWETSGGGIEAIDDVETMAELWYRTMLLMTSDATFTDCRMACEAAAAQMKLLGLLSEQQVNTVTYAFDTCGIEYAANVDLTTDKSLVVTVYDGDKNETDDYHCVIKNQNGDVTDEFYGSDIGTSFEVDFNEEGIYNITVSYDTYHYPSVTTIVTVGSQSLFKLASLTETQLDIYTTFGTNITGTVMDENGNMLDNVNVTAKGMDTYSYATNSSDGSYILYLPVGSYEVTYELDGYDTVTVQQDIAIGTNQIETVLNAEEAGVSELELYAEILDLFYYGISTQWENFDDFDDEDDEYYDEVSYLWWFYADYEDLSLSDAGFAFIDLDGDGVSELLVDVYEENGGHGSAIRDLYTYQNGEVIHLAYSAERWQYWLCSSYKIGEHGSGSASTGGYDYYEVKSGSNELVLIESLSYEYEDESSEPIWSYSDSAYASEYDTAGVTMITDDEAQAIMDSYEALDYELTPFSEYEPTTEMETTTSVDWASVYLDFLESEVTLTDEQWLDYDEIYAYAYEYYEGYEEDLYYGGFSLIYVNDDDIPELVMYGTSEATGMLIFTIGENGDMDVMMSERLNSFYYAEDLNLLVNHAGVTGVSWDTVYTITDGTWVQLASGSYEYYDTDGDGILSYYWNGEEVTEAEYEDNLDEYIMSLTLTYPGTDPEYTLDELISWLEAQ